MDFSVESGGAALQCEALLDSHDLKVLDFSWKVRVLELGSRQSSTTEGGPAAKTGPH